MPQVCDYLSPQDLGAVAQHYAGIVRYPKNITKDEFDQALSHGLTVTLVQEGGSQPAMRGAPGGQQDAVHANQVADSIGYDPRAAIYFVAEDPTTLPGSAWATVDQYFQAVKANSKRPVGGYGGLKLTTHLQQEGLITYKWTVQTWGGTDGGTHLEQLVGVNTYGLAVDADQVLQPDYGQHPRPSGPPPAAMKGHNMIVATSTGNGYWCATHDGAVYALGDAVYQGNAMGKVTGEIVGIAGHGTDGYWLYASDGGVFSFGSAEYHGRPDRE